MRQDSLLPGLDPFHVLLSPFAHDLRDRTQRFAVVGQRILDFGRDFRVDLVMLAREMLRDPYWPYHAALTLQDEKAATILPVQYARTVKAR